MLAFCHFLPLLPRANPLFSVLLPAFGFSCCLFLLSVPARTGWKPQKRDAAFDHQQEAVPQTRCDFFFFCQESTGQFRDGIEGGAKTGLLQGALHDYSQLTIVNVLLSVLLHLQDSICVFGAS